MFNLKTIPRPIQRVAAFCLGLALTLLSTSLIAQSGSPEDSSAQDPSIDQAQLAAEMGGLGPIGSLPLLMGLQAKEESLP